MLIGILLLFVSCSINQLAVRAISDVMGGTGGGSVFTNDNDPDLVRDALPFGLKLYETLLEQDPEHLGLLLNTGSGFIMYANAFVHTPADMLPDSSYKKREEMLNRAKKLYLRGRDYLLRAIELKHPGFKDKMESKDMQAALADMSKEDVPFLYWAGAGWFAAISLNIFDMKLAVDIPKAVAIMEKAYTLDPDFGNGLLHEFFLLYYASLPADMGGDDEKARFHFQRAVELSEGKSASPYVALATSLSIKNQNKKEFVSLLEKALAIDPAADPDSKLMNIITQEKAQWYLDHIDDFFI